MLRLRQPEPLKRQHLLHHLLYLSVHDKQKLFTHFVQMQQERVINVENFA